MNFEFSSSLLAIEMDLVEIDENDVSSMRVKIDIRLPHSAGCFSYSASDLWLETAMWDEFEHGLKYGLNDEGSKLIFTDQSQYFKVQLTRRMHCICLLLVISEPLIGKGEIQLQSSQRVDIDSPFLGSFYESFGHWPKYW